ncbi:MAG: rod shape-determining protein MreC [Bacteroidota bacterium]|nr:rod shape-determining protein MreC [Bacteroidota bacterium]
MNSILKYLQLKLHVLLFVFLEILSIIIIVRNNVYQSSYYFNNTRQISAHLHELNSRIFDYFSLYKKNEDLVSENLSLRKHLKSNYVIESKTIFEINDTVYKQRYKYIPAQIITNSTNRNNNYITLNKGRASGIEPGLGVFCPEGVVGIVERVSENYSIVVSLLSTSKFKLVPKISELSYTKGSLEWNGKDPNYLDFKGINKYELIKEGHHIVTSPYTKIFPENIPIGVVSSLSKNDADPFYKIKVKSDVNFGEIQVVYVVFDLFKKEIEQLENEIIIKK